MGFLEGLFKETSSIDVWHSGRLINYDVTFLIDDGSLSDIVEVVTYDQTERQRQLNIDLKTKSKQKISWESLPWIVQQQIRKQLKRFLRPY